MQRAGAASWSSPGPTVPPLAPIRSAACTHWCPAPGRACRSYESHFSDVENAEEASAGLQVALPRMRHLTCLALSSAALDQGVLSAVAAMPRLCRLYASAEWAVLPAGPWQRGLRWLALGHRALLASMQELAAAQALERVTVLSVSWRAARGVEEVAVLVERCAAPPVASWH